MPSESKFAEGKEQRAKIKDERAKSKDERDLSAAVDMAGPQGRFVTVDMLSSIVEQGILESLVVASGDACVRARWIDKIHRNGHPGFAAESKKILFYFTNLYQ